MNNPASSFSRGALALATVIMLQACSEGSTTPVEEDVPEDVASAEDVAQSGDAVGADSSPDVAIDVAIDATQPLDAPGADGPTDASVDASSADATSDGASDVAPIDVFVDARVDVAPMDASVDARPADAPTDLGSLDATADVSVDVRPDAPPADAASDGPSTGASGFASSASWSVPPSGLSDGFFVTTAASGTQWWALLDMDGDRLPDLVQTGDPARTGGYVFGAGTATPHWKVYRNTGAGFSLTAITWSTPNIGLSDGPFVTFSASGTRWWATMDMDGDNRPDLVQTGDPARTGGYVFGAGTATPYWRVFRNTGSGFDATATNWSTPDIGLGDGPYTTTAASGTRWWSTMDMDGDNRPDLVQTGDPTRTGGYVFGAATAGAHWRVFRNTGTGFAASATTWSTPDIGLSDGPFVTYSASGTRWWATMDMDGDRLPDLVQTGDPARTGGYVFGAATAGAHWRVFRNAGGGFSPTGTSWATPDIGLSDGPYVVTAASGTRWWATLDVDGDRRPDLVQTGDPARTGGYVFGAATAGAHWRVFANHGTGFAATGTNWATPDIGLSDGPFVTYSASGTRWWATMDMNGDGRIDLAQTGDPARTGGYVFAGATGAPAYWRVFVGR